VGIFWKRRYSRCAVTNVPIVHKCTIFNPALIHFCTFSKLSLKNLVNELTLFNRDYWLYRFLIWFYFKTSINVSRVTFKKKSFLFFSFRSFRSRIEIRRRYQTDILLPVTSLRYAKYLSSCIFLERPIRKRVSLANKCDVSSARMHSGNGRDAVSRYTLAHREEGRLRWK